MKLSLVLVTLKLCRRIRSGRKLYQQIHFYSFLIDHYTTVSHYRMDGVISLDSVPAWF